MQTMRRAALRATFRTGTWAASRPYWLGVLNVTPDSFSDGGELVDVAAVMRRAEALVADGADMLDLGGESTNPRATPVSEAEELARVLPALRALCRWGVVPISIDTTKAAVAAIAIAEGAEVVNDISGGRFDAGMRTLVAAQPVIYIAGHVASSSLSAMFVDEQCPRAAQIADAWHAQVLSWPPGRRGDVWCDPGLGMGKGASPGAHLELIAEMPTLMAATATPVVIGASRKRFIRALLADEAWAASRGLRATPTPTTAELDVATGHVNVAAIAAGAHVIRVHNIAQSRQIYAAWRESEAAPAISR
ncbi:MAG: dihydropteroate synthase [Myxococcales bacterium]|nr:dihydropteroate synthase [Myxococcales bacterium]